MHYFLPKSHKEFEAVHGSWDNDGDGPVDISDMIGKTFSAVWDEGDKSLIFETGDELYVFFHHQECCEYVRIEDICGDLSDLVGAELLMADVASNKDNPPELKEDASHTWTFYRFGTLKGYVTVRWLGESNGYYSEEVDVLKMRRIPQDATP